MKFTQCRMIRTEENLCVCHRLLLYTLVFWQMSINPYCMWESMCVPRVTTVFSVLQTRSEAAEELEKFRKASEEERSAGRPSSPPPPSLTYTYPPVFTPPTPPPAPPIASMIVPPPPPPVLPQGKLSTVAPPSGNAPMNPALAREAMLEAIRSGAAAERLKKVKY